MPIHLELPATFGARLATRTSPLLGLWACAASPVTAEIIASSGCDWVLLDGEHSPNDLSSLLAQLHAMSAYPAAPLVRVPAGETAVIKQYLDLGAQNILVPMVDSGAQAAELVQDMLYPPRGRRGVGSALARSGRWNRVDNYLTDADKHVSLTVQIESVAGVANAEEIITTDGVDAVFVGPSDLAASMGHLGQQSHPEVVDAVLRVIELGVKHNKPVGVNAFVPTDAKRYMDAGAAFVAVGADVAILARGAEAILDSFTGTSATARSSY